MVNSVLAMSAGAATLHPRRRAASAAALPFISARPPTVWPGDVPYGDWDRNESSHVSAAYPPTASHRIASPEGAAVSAPVSK